MAPGSYGISGREQNALQDSSWSHGNHGVGPCLAFDPLFPRCAGFLCPNCVMCPACVFLWLFCAFCRFLGACPWSPHTEDASGEQWSAELPSQPPALPSAAQGGHGGDRAQQVRLLLLCLRGAVVGQGRERPGMGRAGMPSLCCQLPAVCLAVAVPWWHRVDVTPLFPHCRTCSSQDDTTSELQRGASLHEEQRADRAFRGQGALARYLCVPLPWGEPSVPGLDTGAFCGARIPFCCMEFMGCRDECLSMLLFVPVERVLVGDGFTFPAGSLPLPPSPTDPSYSRGNDSGAGLEDVELYQGALYCLYSFGPISLLQGVKKQF